MAEQGRDLLAFFNSIYKNDADKIGFELDDMEEFRSVLGTLEKYGMPTKNFLDNLTTLAMKKTSFDNDFTHANYSPKYNKINYKDKKFIKHELFHMAASKKGQTTGVSYIAKNGMHVGEALNEGITELFSKLNDPSYEVQYPFEKMVSETLCFIYGGFDIFKGHFNNDCEEFLNDLGDVRLGRELLVQLDKFRNSYIQVVDKLTIEEKFDETEFYQVRFLFEQVLVLLTELYYKKGNKDKDAFHAFVINALGNEEMEQVRMIVTNFGNKDLLSTKFKGKLM